MATTISGATIINQLTGFDAIAPNVLFDAGEQGAWFDPSDLSTMYSVIGGPINTPIAGVENTVALILDKRNPSWTTTGSELVSNPGPGFVNTTGWSAYAGGSAAVSSGKLRVTTNNAFSGVQTSIATTVGKVYKISATAALVSGTGGLRLYKSDDTGVTVNWISSGAPATTVSSFFVATATTTYITLESNLASTVYDWDFVSVKEVAGNHATQATAGNRPTLSARVNLLTKTQEFDDAAWSKFQASITPNSTAAPDGTTTADTLTTTGSTGSVNVSALSAGTFTISIYAKAGTGSTFAIDDATSGNGRRATFNLSAGTTLGVTTTGTGGTSSGGTASITSVGNGWYLCSLVGVTNSVGVRPIYNCLDNLSSVYIWGADLRSTSDGVGLPVYQRVDTATSYDTAAFPLYLSFNGTSSFMSTASINFTGTSKVTLFCGTRKLSDVAIGALVELSVASVSNGGVFALFAPGSVGASTYSIRSSGSADNVVGFSTYSAPITNVVSGALSTIAASYLTAVSARINGSSVTGSAGVSNTSAGNFGNYPLYVGARGGASLWFNGRLYSLIVRGAETTAATISGIETWVNSKTRAY